MAYRTKLTAPPGEQLETAPSPRTDEWWSPGFALPDEPRPPSRWRSLLALLAVLVVGALIAFAVFNVLTAGQGEDPSLEVPLFDRDG